MITAKNWRLSRETAEMISPWQKMIADIAEQSNVQLDANGSTPGGYRRRQC